MFDFQCLAALINPHTTPFAVQRGVCGSQETQSEHELPVRLPSRTVPQ